MYSATGKRLGFFEIDEIRRHFNTSFEALLADMSNSAADIYGRFKWSDRDKLMALKWGQVLLCGWPGLSRLWLRGDYSALFWAIGFSMVFNLALVSTFLWPTFLGDEFPAFAWPVIFLIWILSTWSSLYSVASISGPPTMSAEHERNEFSGTKFEDRGRIDPAESEPATAHTLFNQAQLKYLRGQWPEAESLLKQQIDESERDIEARLLLATIFRRDYRFEDALAQLKFLEKFDESVHWEFEITRERQLIEKANVIGNE